MAAQIKALSHYPSVHTANSESLKQLNRQFPSFEEFQSQDELHELVEQAQARSQQLNSQLASSRSNLDRFISQTRNDAQSYLQTAQELSLLRHSLSDEIAYLSLELVSSMGGEDQQSTLLEDLETMHRSLKELESVKSYVQVIQHALSLSEAGTRQARDFSSHSSVSEYTELQAFVESVVKKCAIVEQNVSQHPLHLVAFLQELRDKTWSDIKTVLYESLMNASEQLKWPLHVDYPSATAEQRNAFEKNFRDLLKLQALGEELGAPKTDGIYPIQALVHPIALRFKFHFEGSRQTNQLDKPEWYFAHVLNVAHDQRPFIESVVQKLLSQSKYKNINAWREFVLSMLPMLTKKLRRSIPSLLSHPPLLAHTIYQALSFDGNLRDAGFELAATSAAKSEGDHWPGISDIVLGRLEWFDTWLQGENKFALDQYHTFMSGPDAWLIADDHDHDSSVDHELKPTNSARRIKALVEQVTDRYSPLPNATHRMEFLVTIQLPLLEMYQSRVSSSLDAFETLSSAFVRAVPGALGRDPSRGGGDSTKKLTSGVEGVQRLCKALISAKYVLNAMDTWGEDLFFLELWTDIVQTSALRVRAEENKLLPNPPPVKEAHSEGTVFSALSLHYTALSDRAEDMVAQHVYSEVEIELRAHLFNISNGTNSTSESESNDIEIASTLLTPISLLSSHIAFIQSVLPAKTLADLYRRVATRLSAHILQRMIMYRGQGRIGAAEARTIMSECELWLETCRIALSQGGRRQGKLVEGPWRRLVEAGRLLGAQGEDWKKIRELTFGRSEDEEWEQGILAIVGMSELTRDEVGTVLKTREDYGR